MKKKLENLLLNTVNLCFEQGLLKRAPFPEFVVEVPNNPKHGHFATNLPMTLASSQGRPPREIAQIIIANLNHAHELVEKAQVAGPGFINFKIKPQQWYGLLCDIIRRGENYGRNDLGQGEKIVVEFVSANPTGPIHLGHGRGAALGDTLCRILAFCGYDVAREFYINDAGQQIRILGESVYARWKQQGHPEYPFPENGYHGDYILDLAKKIDKNHDLSQMSEEEAIETCARESKKIMLKEIREDLARFRVEFDVWFSETDLVKSGLLEKALETIKEKEQLYEKDEALWIKTSAFGDDKDRVIRKHDGQFTYFATDISYHMDKRSRGFDKAINLWGADHHGYVPRMMAALSANGFPENWLSVMLIQLVKLWEKGQEVRMSKRAGAYVTLEELLDEVGVDPVRFVFLSKNHDSPLDFDIDLVKKQDSENPVYYVQYAHARICSIFRKAASMGIQDPKKDMGIPEHLVLEEEFALMRTMAEFPSLLEDMAKSLEPHRLTYYLTDLAAAFHKYFNLGNKNPELRIVTEDLVLSEERLLLADAVRTVLANGLRLLGIRAPEKM